MKVLDFSWSRPDLNGIKAAGYLGVMRYLSHDTSGKNLTPDEKAAITAAGLEYGLVWESTANAVQGGADAGANDAQAALAQANALGYTGPIYFAVDYDAPESDQPAINAYFQAAGAVIGFRRLGCYGGYYPLKRLFDGGYITYGWQTLAWSGGNRENRAHLYQNGAQDFGADVNDVLKDNWNKVGETNMPTIEDLSTAQKLAYWGGGRDPGDPANLADLQANHIGADLGNDINNWWNSQEWRDYNAQIVANKDAALKLQDARSQIQAQAATIAALNAQVTGPSPSTPTDTQPPALPVPVPPAQSQPPVPTPTPPPTNSNSSSLPPNSVISIAPVHPKVKAAGVAGGLTALVVAGLQGAGVHLSPEVVAAFTALAAFVGGYFTSVN